MQAYPVSTCHTIFTGPLHVAVPPHIVFLKKLKIPPNNPSRQQKRFLHQPHCKYTACSWRISRFLINYFCAYRRWSTRQCIIKTQWLQEQMVRPGTTDQGSIWNCQHLRTKSHQSIMSISPSSCLFGVQAASKQFDFAEWREAGSQIWPPSCLQKMHASALVRRPRCSKHASWSKTMAVHK